jgi:phosphonate degradation associated HDIG domain protein
MAGQGDTNMIDRIERLFAERGAEAYGESVSQLEHALQTAAEAERAGASPGLVAAALLHDIGHLLPPGQETAHRRPHNESGAAFLAEAFGAEVSEPTRLHVPAKRYLCATEPDYASRLSPASVMSLARQGGPMTQEEAAAFEREPYCRDAVSLRRWDEQGKVPGRAVPGLEHYRPLLEGLLAGAQEARR